MNLKACKIPMKNSTIKGATGIAHGTSKSMMSKNMSSPLMLPKRRKESEMMRDKCEMISTGNMMGMSHLTAQEMLKVGDESLCADALEVIIDKDDQGQNKGETPISVGASKRG